MKQFLFGILVIVLQGCAMQPLEIATVVEPSCAGNVDLPKGVASKFEPVTDDVLLAESLGEPEQGKLCQGQVYKSKAGAEVTLYRAWNSTNPNSQFGQWWAFYQPAGEIAQYREDYEICYQWSPLDKMVKCTLKTNTKVVVGNGQSAKCSEYLTYPVSAKQQIYIVDAKNQVMNCTEYEGMMSWQ